MTSYVDFNEFLDTFKSSDNYKDNFTYEGLKALFNYLEEYEEQSGESLEFDMVSLCCQFSEYDNFEELKANYSDIENMEELEGKTQVIKIEGQEGFIIQDF